MRRGDGRREEPGAGVEPVEVDRPPVGAGGERSAPRKDPLWARLLIIIGAFVVLGSGGAIVGFKLAVAQATGSVTQTNLLGDAGNQAGRHLGINGPANRPPGGIDPRPGQHSNDPSPAD